MQKNVDLLNGPVLPSLTRLAIPIMATSLIQMAYNLTDMIWIGQIGSNAVAAVGAAGMYMWLSNGLAALSKMGGQVNVGHALGAGRRKMHQDMPRTPFSWPSYSESCMALPVLYSQRPSLASFG